MVWMYVAVPKQAAMVDGNAVVNSDIAANAVAVRVGVVPRSRIFLRVNDVVVQHEIELGIGIGLLRRVGRFAASAQSRICVVARARATDQDSDALVAYQWNAKVSLPGRRQIEIDIYALIGRVFIAVLGLSEYCDDLVAARDGVNASFVDRSNVRTDLGTHLVNVFRISVCVVDLPCG